VKTCRKDEEKYGKPQQHTVNENG